MRFALESELRAAGICIQQCRFACRCASFECLSSVVRTKSRTTSSLSTSSSERVRARFVRNRLAYDAQPRLLCETCAVFPAERVSHRRQQECRETLYVRTYYDILFAIRPTDRTCLLLLPLPLLLLLLVSTLHTAARFVRHSLPRVNNNEYCI